MQTLAALMVSMMLLTTALFAHALTHQQSPSQPAPLAGRTMDDHRQLAVIRGR
jgi:Spy/CpxP family protein refolding chaperone